MAWVTPKDDWVAGDNVGNGDFNRIEGNIVDLDSRVDTLEADERGQFTLTLTGFTATHTVVVGYKKERALYTGGPSIVTLALPDTSFTDGDTDELGATGLPAGLRPTDFPYADCTVVEGGFKIAGRIRVNADGSIKFYTLGVFYLLGTAGDTAITNSTGETPRVGLEVTGLNATYNRDEGEKNFADVAAAINTEKYLGLNDFKNGSTKGFAAQTITYPVWP
jgi:hypothetical protein